MAEAHRDERVIAGIRQVAADLGVTERTLRFYEKEGLIEPQRLGTTRVYGRREIARMKLILRGKRLGFSIADLKDFLDLYRPRSDHNEQTQLLVTRVRSRIAEMLAQQQALTETLTELRAIEAEALASLEDQPVLSTAAHR
ncbi:MerR family transcriptional regulator [Sphingomonas bacterium]|uniref:MerR family transcriptional regulator n=1 Tax=Sphingomonas bacterium TaxID=1895847 RepID=UPI00157554E8|nr:MerR family transcriptional regulator [Sphingomonas bacterium]